MNINLWLGHWYLARSRRATLASISFKKKAEKFFRRLGDSSAHAGGVPFRGVLIGLLVVVPVWTLLIWVAL